MKWSIFVCLLACLARFCEAGALRCPPGVTECTEDIKEVSDKNESSTSSHTGSTTECLAGSEWESNCHYCRCSDSGIAECLKSRSCEDGVYEEPYLCKPNTTFLRDCNKCLCLDNGMALCSMEFCSNKPQILSIEDIDKVETTANSEVTDIVVPSEEYGRQNTINNNHDVLKRSAIAICTPNEEFQSDCNSCKCDADGRSYSCTHNECLEPDMDEEVEVFKENEGVDHVERHSVCRARSTFYVSCNTCHCNEMGTDYTCTNKPCPLPDDVELFHELKTATPYTKNESKAVVCEANRMFVKDCNTCWCNEDGTSYFCTRRVCVPLLPDEEPDLGGIPAEDLRVTKKKCRPDEVFELDCNMCRCNPDGTSYSCTRRACFEIEKKNVTLSRKVRAFTSEPTKTCQPGQEFRLDCNKCLCDNEGQDFSCTRIDCNALNNNQHATRRKRDTTEKIETQCVAGSVFDRDCNVCRCTQDGNHAVCTNKSCVQQNEVDHDRAPETGFRCTPGEQFKRECNDCTCSADGRSVFCTLRLCGLTPDI